MMHSVLNTGPKTERTLSRSNIIILLEIISSSCSAVKLDLVSSQVLRVNLQAGWEQGWTARAMHANAVP